MKVCTVSCTRCGRTGHTRANRKFHPDTKPLGKRGKEYWKAHYREKKLGASMHEKCIICREPVNRRHADGEPMTRCKSCQDGVEANRAKYLRLRRVYQAALEQIAAGADPVATAQAALADEGTTERKAA